MAQTELTPASYDPVEYTHEDIAEVPSADWGWTGESRRAMRIAALVVAAAWFASMDRTQAACNTVAAANGAGS